MALATLARSKHRPFVSGGTVTFTGSTTVATGFQKDRPIRAVSMLVVATGTPATTINLSPGLSFVDNGDGTITLHSWRYTTPASNPTLIAGNAAVTVMVRIEVD